MCFYKTIATVISKKGKIYKRVNWEDIDLFLRSRGGGLKIICCTKFKITPTQPNPKIVLQSPTAVCDSSN